MQTASRTHYTEAQQDANWDNLSPEQRTYFNGLAAADPERTGQAFFEDEVPPSLQDDPVKLDVYLNGGTVETEVYVYDQGRAGGHYETVQHEVPDRDWSHDTSRANGGSDSADNGRFEDASTNRARGSRNSTEAEQQAADEASARDAKLLEEGTLVEEAPTTVQDVERGADVVLAGEASELLGTVTDFALDFVGPLVGAGVAAKLVSDQFDKTEHKVLAGGGAAVLTGAVLCTPVGQVGLGCYLGYKLCKTGWRFFNN